MSLADILRAHSNHPANIARTYNQYPEQAALGINTPLETGIWNSVLGTNYQPVATPLGGPIQMAKGGLAAAQDQVKERKAMAIIAHYFKNLGLPLEPAMAGVQKEIANGLKLSQYQNSVMGYKDLGNGTAQIHFFTNGTVKSLADDIRFFVKQLKSMGIDTVYDSRPAPVTTQVLQQEGARIMQSDNPKFQFKAMI